MIELKEVTRIYKMGKEEIRALDGVSLTIPEGQFLAIFGPSGSGKSTLLHIIGGLDSPTSGVVIVDGKDLSKATDKELSAYRNTNVGFVFQMFNLQPAYTALENVALPLVFAKIPPKERRRRAIEALEAVGLSDRIGHRPSELSGGERQRVGIARALVNNPKIILADEPTGNLDTKTGARIVELLARLNEERGVTLVIVTHDPEVARHSHRIIFLRDGKILREEER
jgi:putative ABC transport system ATP-binding protein